MADAEVFVPGARNEIQHPGTRKRVVSRYQGLARYTDKAVMVSN